MKNIVIWGHTYGSTTHSWIHDAYAKAFRQFFNPVLWLTDNESSRQHCLNHLDPSDTLFFVEGQQEKFLPILDDAHYIFHNVDINDHKYKTINNYINLQVYTHDVLSRNVRKLSNCEYWESSTRTLYQPWATDLLPHEFNLDSIFDVNSSMIGFIGTAWGGEFGNYDELMVLSNRYGGNFGCFNGLTNEQNRKFINQCKIAPAIQGKWQVNKGYIPCRIFKNISYGHFGVTNNPTVKDLLPFCVYHSDINILMDQGEKIVKKDNINDIVIEQMTYVRANHTYINRIHNINKFLDIGL